MPAIYPPRSSSVLANQAKVELKLAKRKIQNLPIQERKRIILDIFGDYLQAQEIPDPPERFHRITPNGTRYTIVPEYRGNLLYWLVDKQYKKERLRKYIGPCSEPPNLIFADKVVDAFITRRKDDIEKAKTGATS